MKSNMMDTLKNVPLNMAISDYCYPISPIIKLKSGYTRIETVIDNYIRKQSHEWADDSLQTLDEEIQMLHHFYNEETEAEQKEKEMHEITKRYKPRITYKVINGRSEERRVGKE